MDRPEAPRAGDVWGGVSAMLVALPSAMGFGITIYAVLGPERVGSGAIAGLTGAFALGIVAPLFGGSRRLISAPCGPAALLLSTLTADLLTRLGGGAPAPRVLLVLTLVALLSAALQFAYGALGGGRLIKYIPYPVVAGYLSSIGILLFAKQVPDFLGLRGGAAGLEGLASPSGWAWPAVLVGAATVVGMLFGPRLTKRVPGVILGLAAGGLAYAVLSVGLSSLRTLAGNPLVVGPVGGTPSELAAAVSERWAGVGTLSWRDLGLVLAPALTLSVLLSIDTLKTCVIVDALTHSRSDSNRELRGQGLGNLASALLGGIPGAGVMGATLVNISSGGQTRRSGVVEGASALVAVGAFGGLVPGIPALLGWLPKAALAGIIMTISVRMIDRHSFTLLRHRSTWPDFLVVVAVVVTAVLASPMEAAGVGLGLAIVLFIRDQVRGSVVRRKLPGNRVSSKRRRSPAEVAVLQERGAEATFCTLQGTLFFGTTDQLLTLLEDDLARCRFLVLDMRRVRGLDFTAAHMLEQMAEQLATRGARLVFSGVPGMLPTGLDLRAYLRQLGLEQRERSVLFFDELDDAVEWVEDDILSRAGLERAPGGPPLGLADFEVFRELDADSLTMLSSIIEERAVARGDPVFRRGDDGDELFLIRAGTVQILLPLDADHRHVLATFTAGSFFGDMAFLDRGARSADAIAREDTELFALSRERLNALSHRHPQAGAMFFARLAGILALRLRQADAELQALAEA